MKYSASIAGASQQRLTTNVVNGLAFLGRGIAIYAGTGLCLGLLARATVGPEAWMDFHGKVDLVGAAEWWALFWPFLLYVNILNLTRRP